ncbi:MAG: phenylalanine--tRNA ligase subunit alpha [Aeropyrum sp.]|nr:phenylalanine--tRNA ligase subunit alpha [Aeropyrum sp.]
MGEILLSEGEYRILKKIAESGFKEGTIDEAAKALGIEKSTLASLSVLLAEKGLLEVEEHEYEELSLTHRGIEALESGLPEEKLLEYVVRRGGRASLKELREALGSEAGIAIGQAKKRGIVEVSSGEVFLKLSPEEAKRALRELREALESVSVGRKPRAEILSELLSRGLARKVKKRIVRIRAPDDVKSIIKRSKVEISKLTHQMLKSGEWRGFSFRPYNVRASPPRVLPARRHFLSEFIDYLRDVMRDLGFTEVRGPLVELELFNFDMLFQAQDHPAREIHDSLWIRKPRRGDLSGYGELVERVGEVHRRGWGYEWSSEVASRYVLRSQTTAVSARILALKPEPPARYFTVGKVFRSDAVGPTRLPEFHQLDGIEGDSSYTFRELLGRLEEIASMLGLKLRFKPAYFPFTEPSVEGYVRLPNGKWLELFGAGMFRPEVLEAAGVDYPVGAWGFGIERLAMAYYGVGDIRKLYTRDIDEIRAMRMRWF